MAFVLDADALLYVTMAPLPEKCLYERPSRFQGQLTLSGEAVDPQS